MLKPCSDERELMKRLLFPLLLLLIIIPLNGFGGPVYTLEELFGIALKRSEVIKIAEEQHSISGYGEDRALSALIPDLSAFGQHTRYSDKKIKNGFLLQPEQTSEWGLRLGETLSLGGGEFFSLGIARKEREKSFHDLRAVKEDHLYKVAEQYYAVLLSRRGEEIAESNLERLKKHRDSAARRLEVGEVTETVLLRSEAELAGARSELIRAKNDLKIAIVRLADLTGIEGPFDLAEPPLYDSKAYSYEGRIREEFVTAGCEQPLLDCLKATAYRMRPELRAKEYSKKIAEELVKVARSEDWPDISLEGVYMRQENDPSSSFGLKERIYGTVRLDIPVFDGGRRRADTAEARAKLRQAEYEYELIKSSIGVEVESAYLILMKEAAALSHLRAENLYAHENYISVTKQFEHGLSDSVDVIDANDLLVSSERSLAGAKYRFELALLKLKKATGRLLDIVKDG
jgi:outer membrane protein